MIYVYEPFNHQIIETTVKDFANQIGISKMTIHQYLYKGMYYQKLGCYLLKEKPTLAKRKILNEQLNPKEEIWRFNEEYQLYVSNLGRFKNKEGIYKFSSDVHGRITLFQEGKAYKAANIVYETFKGNIEAGLHAYPKNGIYNDIKADNLYIATFSEYCSTKRIAGRSKPVMLIDSNNNIIEEFTSTTEAQNYLYQDRSVIARKCNKRLEENGLTYIWAKDYEVMACC